MLEQRRRRTPVWGAMLLAVLLCGVTRTAAFAPSFFGRGLSALAARQRLAPRWASVQDDVELSKPSEGAQAQSLTQKEYLIAVRNRLFAVEEQIWLHEYAVSKPDVSKVPPLSEKKYDELLRARGDLLDEYPSTKLYTDLMDAQQRNLTYAAMYLERLIGNFNRQMPVSLDHINQIAVLSFSGQVNDASHAPTPSPRHLSPLT